MFGTSLHVEGWRPITIKQMSKKREILTSQFSLRKGISLDRVSINKLVLHYASVIIVMLVIK